MRLRPGAACRTLRVQRMVSVVWGNASQLLDIHSGAPSTFTFGEQRFGTDCPPSLLNKKSLSAFPIQPCRPDCVEMPLQKLCTVALTKGVEGGVSGVDPRFDRFVLALYWAPTYCKHDQGSFFCSPFARPGTPSAKRLALHGLWPDWGAPNGAKATAWPQFCDDFFACQGDNHTEHQCLIPSTTVATLNTSAAWQAYAPAWAAPRGEAGANLGDHEWAKHGSCAGVGVTLFAHEVLSKGIPEVEGRGAVFQLGAATTGTVKLSQVKATYVHRPSCFVALCAILGKGGLPSGTGALLALGGRGIRPGVWGTQRNA